GAFEEDEEPSDRDVLPESVGRKRPRSPDADSATGKLADRVDAARVQNALRVVVDFGIDIQGAAHDLISRRLEDATLDVRPRVDSEHMTARWHGLGRATLRIGGHYPGCVEGGIRRVPIVRDAWIEI